MRLKTMRRPIVRLKARRAPCRGAFGQRERPRRAALGKAEGDRDDDPAMVSSVIAAESTIWPTLRA